MSIAIKQNVIHWEIQRGVSADTAINKPDGWAMYEEILMHFKSSRDIHAFSQLRLSLGQGLTILGNQLLISLTYQQTEQFTDKVIYADIKLRSGAQVLPAIPFQIIIKDTVTRIPS